MFQKRHRLALPLVVTILAMGWSDFVRAEEPDPQNDAKEEPATEAPAQKEGTDQPTEAATSEVAPPDESMVTEIVIETAPFGCPNQMWQTEVHDTCAWGCRNKCVAACASPGTCDSDCMAKYCPSGIR